MLDEISNRERTKVTSNFFRSFLIPFNVQWFSINILILHPPFPFHQQKLNPKAAFWKLHAYKKLPIYIKKPFSLQIFDSATVSRLYGLGKLVVIYLCPLALCKGLFKVNLEFSFSIPGLFQTWNSNKPGFEKPNSRYEPGFEYLNFRSEPGFENLKLDQISQ